MAAATAVHRLAGALIGWGVHVWPRFVRATYAPFAWSCVDGEHGTEYLLHLDDPPAWVVWPKVVLVRSSLEELRSLWERAHLVHRSTPSRDERLEVNEATLRSILDEDPPGMVYVVFQRRTERP